jgi:hypothetical protein
MKKTAIFARIKVSAEENNFLKKYVFIFLLPENCNQLICRNLYQYYTEKAEWPFKKNNFFLKKSFIYFGDNKNGFTFAPPLKEMTR